MKALSIRQPWAWAILHGGKDIENRDWPTDHRGALLIHAAKLEEADGMDSCFRIMSAQTRIGVGLLAGFYAREKQLGGLVGVATVNGCVTKSASPWFTGRFGWEITMVAEGTFVEWRGQQGLFDVPPDVVARMNLPRWATFLEPGGLAARRDRTEPAGARMVRAGGGQHSAGLIPAATLRGPEEAA